MKLRLFLSTALLLFWCTAFGQTYRFNYSHDTIGNRTSRVYQGAVPSKGSKIDVFSEQEVASEDVADVAGVDSINTTPLLQSTAERDIVQYGPLVKTQAEKDACRKQMMEELLRLKPYVSPGEKSSSSTYSVGEIPLQYGVSGSGARTYSVPIYTAPDIKYAPSLSLVYNSQGGHGYGGYGWDLGGISAITLTSKTIYWDDTVKAASAQDTAGVFCLDGIRLVRNDNSVTKSAYPLVTATGHILVAPVRGVSGYIKSFNVLYPDGTRAVFGTGTDLGFTLPAYPVVRATNIEGKKIEYAYTLDNTDGNHTLNSISYGFNNSGTATASVQFTSVADTAYIYFAGKKIRRSPRITCITSISSGITLYTYSLTYQTIGGTQMLKTISLSNSSGNSLPPLTFTYWTEAFPHSGQDSIKLAKTRSLAYIFSPGESAFVLKRGKFSVGNYNDGLIAYRDLPIYEEDGLGGYICDYSASNYAFTASIQNETYMATMPTGTGFQTAEAVDTNGDGVDELIRVCCGATSELTMTTSLDISKYRLDSWGNPTYHTDFSVYLTGVIDGIDHVSPYLRTYRWGDFLGNGKTQLMVLTYSDNSFNESQTASVALVDLDTETKLFQLESTYHMQISSSEDKRIFAADIDGDGRTEVCQATSGGLRIYRLNQNGYTLERTLTSVPVGVIDSNQTYYTDINSDGYLDILKAPDTGSGWDLYMNTGLDYVNTTVQICSVSSTDGFLFMDIDRDGYPDLMKISGTSIGFYPNQSGLSFGQYKSGNISVSALGNILPPNVVDYTSMSSFMIADGQYIYDYYYTSYAQQMRLMRQSKDSYGKFVVNDYGYLPHHSLYWTDNPTGIVTSAGYQLRTLPLYVLTVANGMLSSASTSPDFLSETYEWHDGVVHTRGLGFCGFCKTRTESTLDGEKQVYLNSYNPQKRGIPVNEAKYITNEYATAFKTTTYTFDEHTTTYGKLSPRLSQMVTSDNVTGVTTTTTYTYDSYDYPQYIYTVKTGYVGSSQMSTSDVTTISYDHHNNINKYVLGSVNTQTTMSDRNGDNVRNLGERFTFVRDTLYRVVKKRTYKARYDSPASMVFYSVSTQQWTYDSHGNITREESAPSGSNVFVGKSYAYDSSGKHMVSSTDEMGHVTLYSGFNAYGAPTTITNYKGQNTSVTYDGWGRVLQTTYPNGTIEAVSRSWSTVGSYEESKTVTGQPDVKVTYDAMGRNVLSSQKRFNGQWQTIKTEYKQRGLIFRVSLPYQNASNLHWKTYGYDHYGRVESIIEDSGRQTTWLYSGTAVTEVKDGVSVTRRFDPAGNLKKVTDASGTFTYNYQDDGQLSSVGRTTSTTVTFAYDTIGRRTSIVDPSAGTRTTSYTINSNGTSSVTETNALGSIISSYDALGRMTGIVRPDFNTVFSYDTCGRLISAVSTNSTSTEYTYDAYDRVLSFKESVPDSRWLQKAYTYGSGGNVSTIAYTSQRGYITTETYGYTNGHNTSITLPDNTVVFQLDGENPLGQPTSATSGNVSRSYGYTDYGLPTFRKLNNGTLQNFAYTFDATTGNLSSRARTQGGTTTTETFSYDNLGRLSAIGSNTITYSAANNITSVGGLGTMAYTAGTHPYTVTRLDTATPSTVGTATQTVTYKAYDRPATITQGNYSAEFMYNASHDRVKMTVTLPSTDELTRYYIGGNYEVQVDDEQGITTENLYLGGDAYSAPMVLQSNGGTTWTPYVIGRDYLGSITHLAYTNGNWVERKNYGAWGTGSPVSALWRGYCGHEHLTMFGLINMNARLYDPVLGRFLSPDPFIQAPDIPGNFNRYAYCLNNPLKYTDESGEVFGTILGLMSDLINNVFVKTLKGEEWDWTQTKLGWEIDKAWFYTDSNKSEGGQIWEVVSRFTWQLPQTVIGDIFVSGANALGLVNSITHNYGITAVDMGLEGGAVTIGHFSAGPKGYIADWRDNLFVHEYGHYIQSQQQGLAFLFVVGLPSLMSAELSDLGPAHIDRWFEANASKQGANYFDKYYGPTVGLATAFDKIAFSNDKYTTYINPRDGGNNYYGYPTDGAFHWTDPLLYVLELYLLDFTMRLIFL